MADTKKALTAAQRKSIGERTRQRRVVMKSSSLDPTTGEQVTLQAEDYVPEDVLDVYLADARTRWQYAQADEGYDCGPGGEEVSIPPHLVGKSVADFARYGGPERPENALDEFHGTQGTTAVGLSVTNGS